MPGGESLDEAQRPAKTSRNASGRAIAVNAVSGYFTLFAGALIGLISTPILLHALGSFRFGTYSLLGATAAYLGLLEVGLGTASTIRIAAAEHEGQDAVAAVLSTSIALFALVALAAVGVTCILTLLLTSLFAIPHELHASARVAFLLIGAGQALNSAVTAYTAALLGTGRMYLVNLLGFSISAAVSIVTILCAVADPSLPLLGAVQAVGATVMLVVFRLRTRKALGDIRPRIRNAQRSIMRLLYALGWRNAVSSVMGTLAYGSDLVLVGLLVTPGAVTAYAIALSGYAFLQRFTNTALGAMGPSYAYRAATADRDQGFVLLCNSTLMTLSLATLCALPVALFARGLLHLWLGRVPAHSVGILIIFCAVLVIQAPCNAASVMLTNYSRATEVMRLTTLSACVNVAASICFTVGLGSVGPALGSLVAVSCVDLVLFPRRACRALGQSYLALLKRAVLPVLGPSVVFVILLLATRRLADHGLLILPLIACACVCYILMLSFAAALAPVRERILRLRTTRSAT